MNRWYFLRKETSVVTSCTCKYQPLLSSKVTYQCKEGCVEVSYTDLEGERKKLDSIDCRLPHSDRMFEVSRSLLASAVKQTDLNLLTDFRVQNPTGVPTLAILINNAAFETALEARQQLHIMRILRQREVLKYYGIETE